MKKRTLSAILTLVMLLALCAPAFAANVVLSPQNLTVDGKAVACEKYNIGGANYFKLRDLAQALSGTSSQFEVGWDGATGTVSITTGKTYTSIGGELSAGADKSSTAQVSKQTIQINGVTRSDLSAYNIGGANFFKLRDLGTALGFGVDFDAGTNTAVVTSGAVTVAGTDKSSMLAAAVYRKASILNDTSAPTIAGTTYYVSNGGSDSNDGKTPQTAWATLNKVNGASLKAGDGVLFERGGVFRGYLIAQTGVTYAAYGTGAKPTISGSPENGAGAGKWSLYGETPDGGTVWVSTAARSARTSRRRSGAEAVSSTTMAASMMCGRSSNPIYRSFHRRTACCAALPVWGLSGYMKKNMSEPRGSCISAVIRAIPARCSTALNSRR